MDTDTEINMDTDMDTETDEQVFIKSPHLEIVAPWLAYRREGVYYFAYHEAYADVAFIALLEQSSTTYTYLSHVIPPPVPRRRPVPLFALSPFFLCAVPGGSPADTGPYPRGE